MDDPPLKGNCWLHTLEASVMYCYLVQLCCIFYPIELTLQAVELRPYRVICGLQGMST